MNVTIECDCCHESRGDAYAIDKDLGNICMDCNEGLIISSPALRKSGISGIYNGPCPDNDDP